MPTQCSVHPVWVVAIACALLVGCGAEWTDLKVADGYQPAKRLNVTVLATSERDNWREAVETFTTTLRHELKSKGIDASFGSAPPDGAGAELTITEWDPGDRALRYFVGFGSGQSHMTIVVSVTDTDGATSLEGKVRGYVSGGWFGGDALDAPREAAKSIAHAIATGNVAPESPESHGFH